MIYFIPWVVFLAFVILSVPIAAWLEKRRLRAQFPERFEDEEEVGEEEAGEEGDAEEVVAEGEEGEVVFEDSGDFAAEGAEDLSSFEDFK